jgi:hypothetical protein
MTVALILISFFVGFVAGAAWIALTVMSIPPHVPGSPWRNRP